MKYWLLKTEPEEWSWKQQVKSGKKGTEWNGVRNFQAAKNLRNMKKGDKCFFYHTGNERKIVGVAKKNNSLLPITEIVDQYYGDVQKLGGKRWDTSSLIKRLRK